MNQRAASGFLAGLLDYINKTPALGWESVQPVFHGASPAAQRQAEALALWREADAALEAGDVQECHRLQDKALAVEHLPSISL